MFFPRGNKQNVSLERTTDRRLALSAPNQPCVRNIYKRQKLFSFQVDPEYILAV